jgi:hypothetical protein
VPVRLKIDRRNVRSPVDIGGYSSETIVCTMVNGIAFYKELNLMACKVMYLKLLWYKEVIENYMFSCLYCMEQTICEI